MCTGATKEVVTERPKAEEQPKAKPELAKIGATKQGDCCEPDCGPSTCGG